MTQFAIVLTTIPTDTSAEPLARTLVEEGLAACVSVLGPVRSVYWWKGQVEAASEQQLIIKTAHARVDGLRVRLTELHPYEVPEFLVVGIEGGSEPYLAWLTSSMRIT